ncbi:MAG: flagellar protein FlaG [Comamonadaceae bacterium]|nr:flagellar protein FlaG [Comamonadaceae bacterium]
MTVEQVEQVVEEMKQVVEPVAQNLQFSVDDATGQTVVRVVDSGTKEVLRQIPSQELLDIARSFDKLQGLLLHEKA